jgi:hypothetical protein
MRRSSAGVPECRFGEAVDPDRLERLARYEVHLDRKLAVPNCKICVAPRSQPEFRFAKSAACLYGHAEESTCSQEIRRAVAGQLPARPPQLLIIVG